MFYFFLEKLVVYSCYITEERQRTQVTRFTLVGQWSWDHISSSHLTRMQHVCLA
jgi:hypothetical protein